MAEKIYDVIVIGGGPGGYTAALYTQRSGFKTAVLEKLSAGGQMATTEQVDNYPGFPDGINGFDLAEKMQKSAERFGVETIYDEVTAVELSGSPKRIKGMSGDLLARAVVIATGAYPRPLGIAGEDELMGRGIAYCATCDGRMYQGKAVAVAGGGNSAAADAIYLSKLCSEVHLIHRRGELRAGKMYADMLSKSGVIIHYNKKVSGFLQDKKLTGVLLEDVETGETENLPCEGLFVAVGRVPETDIFKGQLLLDKSGYIVADESTKTSIDGVFAVGDVRTKVLRQIVTAAADGAVASHYIEEYLAENK